MTNLEALKHLIGSNATLSTERLTNALAIARISPNEDFDPANKCAIYGLAISEIQQNKGVKSITEAGYAVTFSDATSGAIISLALQSGCADLIKAHSPSQPKVIDRSNLW